MDPATLRRWLTGGVVAAALAALVGVVALWPRGEAPDLGDQPTTYVDATITARLDTTCPSVEVDAPTSCTEWDVRLDGGDDAGDEGTFVTRDIDFGVPPLAVGDGVVLLDVPTSPPPYRYTYADLQRATPLWWLVAAFVVTVVAFGRWLGARALAGLAASGLILVGFVVPALLRDRPAVAVALSGTVVIAVAALYLAHGFRLATTVALAGTLLSLLITTVGALLAASAAHLTGLADEQAQVLRVTADALDLRGLLVAGIVVGALGVLDDVTVTQVSTVAALRRADPTCARRRIFAEAIRVGRDHVASTVNTLVLAYAGASLPLVLLFAQGSKPVGRILGSEIVAVEIVRMLVGSIGLVLSVPITTALAAAVITDEDAAGIDDGHGHGHGFPRTDGEEPEGPWWQDDVAPPEV